MRRIKSTSIIDETYILQLLQRSFNAQNRTAINYVKDSVKIGRDDFIFYEWDVIDKYTSNIVYYIFITKNHKRVAYNVYADSMPRAKRHYEYLMDLDEINNHKIERKRIEDEKKSKIMANVKIGDIFVSSWGYDQTNVSAYQVIEKKLKAVIITEIGTKIIEGTEGFMSAEVIPVKDNFINKNDQKQKLIGPYGIKISSYSTASKWDGVSSYQCTWYA